MIVAKPGEFKEEIELSSNTNDSKKQFLVSDSKLV